LRSLYCSSDSVRSRGAAVTYLSHNASFHSKEQIAPSNRGIKHLGIDHSAPSNILEYFACDPEALKRLRDATINAYDVDDCTDFFL
jgi:hypothetical protein